MTCISEACVKCFETKDFKRIRSLNFSTYGPQLDLVINRVCSLADVTSTLLNRLHQINNPDLMMWHSGNTYPCRYSTAVVHMNFIKVKVTVYICHCWGKQVELDYETFITDVSSCGCQ